MAELMRLQKYMSQSGVCSRRKAEEYIKKGLIKINGKVATIGQKVDSDVDKVEMLDEMIRQQKDLVYYKINKPRGIITTCAEYGDKNIIDIIDIKERVFPVGRLDKDTTGLILLTNDGRLTNFLIHPRYNHEKEYVVETFGSISDNQLDKLGDGLIILGKITKKTIVKRLATGRFSIILTEGKNRQIRRMVEKVGAKVKRLKRIRIENIDLGKLKEGDYKHLSKSEKSILFENLGLK